MICEQCGQVINRNSQSKTDSKKQKEKSDQAVEIAKSFYEQDPTVVLVVLADTQPNENRPSCDLILYPRRRGGITRYVEVKSSKRGSFHLTKNELEGLRRYGNEYEVFVVVGGTDCFRFVGKETFGLQTSASFDLSRLHQLDGKGDYRVSI